MKDMNCPSCGKQIRVPEDATEAFCMYCGNQFPITAQQAAPAQRAKNPFLAPETSSARTTEAKPPQAPTRPNPPNPFAISVKTETSKGAEKSIPAEKTGGGPKSIVTSHHRRSGTVPKYKGLRDLSDLAYFVGTLFYVLAGIAGVAFFLSLLSASVNSGSDRMLWTIAATMSIPTALVSFAIGFLIKALEQAIKALRDIARNTAVAAGADWDDE